MGYNPIVSIEGWIIKMIQLYNGIILINKKEQITTTCNNLAECEKHRARF